MRRPMTAVRESRPPPRRTDQPDPQARRPPTDRPEPAAETAPMPRAQPARPQRRSRLPGRAAVERHPRLDHRSRRAPVPQEPRDRRDPLLHGPYPDGEPQRPDRPGGADPCRRACRTPRGARHDPPPFARIDAPADARGRQGLRQRRLRRRAAQACVTPHVAQKARHSAIDGRTTRHAGYALSQKRRKKIEEPFGWAKTVGGMAQTVLAASTASAPASPSPWRPTTSHGCRSCCSTPIGGQTPRRSTVGEPLERRRRARAFRRSGAPSSCREPGHGASLGALGRRAEAGDAYVVGRSDPPLFAPELAGEARDVEAAGVFGDGLCREVGDHGDPLGDAAHLLSSAHSTSCAMRKPIWLEPRPRSAGWRAVGR
jgi:hypothetical protein